jgi:hypothetical protein
LWFQLVVRTPSQTTHKFPLHQKLSKNGGISPLLVFLIDYLSVEAYNLPRELLFLNRSLSKRYWKQAVLSVFADLTAATEWG